MAKKEDKIHEVKLGRKNGVLSVACPGCQRRFYGNALQGYLQSGEIISCRDEISFIGCNAKLRIVA